MVWLGCVDVAAWYKAKISPDHFSEFVYDKYGIPILSGEWVGERSHDCYMTGHLGI